ncbi:MAG: ankyrin repeat domain-containing protein [Spirochaetes bacterium]|nr:ankyrin repeat domain-containing protein [Spirochaetota bacterium]
MNKIFIFLFIVLFSLTACKYKQNTGFSDESGNTEISEADKQFQIDKENLLSEDLNKKGLEFYKIQDYENAQRYFKEAAGLDYYLNATIYDNAYFDQIFSPACYNYACVRAIQYGNNENKDLNEIIKYLSWAFDLDTKWVAKAEKDKDLVSIKESEEFQQLYARSILRYYIEKNDFDSFKNELPELKNIDAFDNFAKSTLFYAVKEKKINFIKYLLDNKANVNRGFIGNNSPIFYLFFSRDERNYEVIKFLVDNGADINARFKRDPSYREYQFPAEDSDVIIEDCINDDETLLNLALQGVSKIYIKLLFDNNVKLDVKMHSSPQPESSFIYVLSCEEDLFNFVIDLLKKREDGAEYIELMNERKKELL